jgi:hypothetical protein
VRGAVDVRILVRVEVLKAIEHALRLLCCGPVVEPDELTVDLPRKEVATDRVRVKISPEAPCQPGRGPDGPGSSFGNGRAAMPNISSKGTEAHAGIVGTRVSRATKASSIPGIVAGRVGIPGTQASLVQQASWTSPA